jgi:hypothetical protein
MDLKERAIIFLFKSLNYNLVTFNFSFSLCLIEMRKKFLRDKCFLTANKKYHPVLKFLF